MLQVTKVGIDACIHFGFDPLGPVAVAGWMGWPLSLPRSFIPATTEYI